MKKDFSFICRNSEEFEKTLGSLIFQVRELEKKALEIGVLEKSDIKSLSVMRHEAWQSYLICKINFLQNMIDNKDFYRHYSVLTSEVQNEKS